MLKRGWAHALPAHKAVLLVVSPLLVPIGILLAVDLLTGLDFDHLMPIAPLVAAVGVQWVSWSTGGRPFGPDVTDVREAWLLRVAPLVALNTLGLILLIASPSAREDVRVALGLAGLGLIVLAEALRRVLRPSRHA